ncbi:opioid growth factor receptor isoform X2 [Choloepus didactylus]|uniref:opioid growth factor receptor isoform X2 n=1 Tax=Choloepus didactylus TaxID=27675 RepID=UPI00189DD53C|nr:opioid growth factor receptor isoform X2 [Choloepus didactylus]
MDDPDCDSTWEEDEEDAEAPRGEGGGDGDGDAAPGDADADEEEDAEDGDADEDEEEQPRAPRPRALQNRMMGSRNWRAVRDMYRYRHNYPDLVEQDCNGDMPNLSFYKNEIRFLPNGSFIEDILQNWKDDYALLEDNHSYIQWLFPLREPGVNWHAKPLTLREVEAFKSSREVMERFVQAYELMLGFYGIELEDRDTGRVRRARNYQRRFQNLNWHSHNNLRITRILKSLGQLGLERFQAPLARFFLEEALVRRQLPGVRQSALDYFVFAVRSRRQRRELLRFAWEHFRPRCKFVWGPHDKLRAFRPRSPPRAPGVPGPAEGTLDEARGAQGGSREPGRDEGGDGAAARCRPPSGKPQDAGGLESEGGAGVDAGSAGERGPEPPSPKENKKRKLEVNRREQGPGEPGASSPSEVEKIALNLEGCALGQGSLGAGGAQDAGPQAPEADEQQPGPELAGPKAADDVRKRRKTDAADPEAATAWLPAPSGRPEAGEGDSGAREEAAGERAGSAPGSPSEAPPAGPREP